MQASIRGTQIFFDIDGAGLVADGTGMRERPTAIFSHGGPGSDHTSMKVQYGRLAEKMQLVFFDHRGHGRSARGDPQKYTLDENVEDLEALRRYLGIGPIVSIGASYGGRVAMAHAARYPKAVSHLVLVGTASHSGSIARAKEIVAERGTPEQVAIYDDLLAGQLDTPEKMRRYHEVMRSLYSGRHDPGSPSGAGGATIHSPEPLIRSHGPNGFMHSMDLRPELGTITAPTLILAGRHDWICAPEFSEELHKLIPGSDLRVFERSGHTICRDEPQECLDAISGFVVYKSRGPGK